MTTLRNLGNSSTKPPPLPLMALTAGVSVANPFYAQSLLPSIEGAFHLQPGMVLQGPMLIQLGMALGYVSLLPLGDAYERRRLLVWLALGMAIACTAVALSPTFEGLLIAWFVLGLVALIPTLLPPFLTELTPEASRGRMLGIVLSGHFSGLLLSRSVSGVVAELWGWRSIYGLAAVAMLGVALLFRNTLPISLPDMPRATASCNRHNWHCGSAIRGYAVHACLRPCYSAVSWPHGVQWHCIWRHPPGDLVLRSLEVLVW